MPLLGCPSILDLTICNQSIEQSPIVFQDGKVHIVQQVRLLRRSGAARRALHPAPQRRQREDLCLPLVLVRHPRHPHLHHSTLPTRHHLLAKNARLHDENALQARQTRQRRHHRQAKQNGRLVPTLHSRREPRLGYLQGYYERVRKQTQPQLPTSYPRCTGRVTSDPRVGVPHMTDVVAA